MRNKLQLKFSSLLIFLGLLALFAIVAQAQVSFVQITDPHVFDDVWLDEDNRLADASALASCLNEINERVAAGQNYDFVVVTGDLGVENLVKGLDRKNETLVAQTLRRAAVDMGAMLALSKVKVWLFVPGNNDVLDEMPENVRYYHEFINALAASLKESNSQVSIIDLCPKDESDPGKKYFSRSAFYKINDYGFIGFNDASFKNSNDEAGTRTRRIELYAEVQKNYARQVSEVLKSNDFKYAYIFYHVPEIDDPYFVTLTTADEPLKSRLAQPALIGNSYFDSSWFVKSEVRDEWNQVVRNPKVKGLFAGHFHDPKRQTYQDFKWLRTRNYPGETLSKLHVCPPLALKLQRGQPEQAQGFQEVYLDKEGGVTSRIVWLDQSQWRLRPEVAAGDAQLELGQTYERGQLFKEAELAYTKAAESSWPPTRERAVGSLERVWKQNSAFNNYLWTPLRGAWIAGVSGLGAALPTIVLVAVLAFGLWLSNRNSGRNRLRIGPFTGSRVGLSNSFEQLMTMIHGRMRVHYGRPAMIDAGLDLPLLQQSQSGEVPEIIETLLPSGLGKVVVWLVGRQESPTYSISGSLQFTSIDRCALFVALHKAGKTLRTWHREEARTELFKNEIDLTFAVMDRLVMRKQ